MDRSRVALVIPALNEVATIEMVIASVRRYGDVIVVDDASTDATGAVALQSGAFVKRNRVNMQYDGALGVGLRTAVEEGFEYALTLDADGQHDPYDIPAVLERLWQGADLVVGIRPRTARFAELWFGMVSKHLWGITDPLCGMKAYRLSWLQRYRVFATHHSIGTELAIRMVCDGARVDQVPINIHMRRDEPRFGGIVRANWKITKALGLNIWRYGRATSRRLIR